MSTDNMRAPRVIPTGVITGRPTCACAGRGAEDWSHHDVDCPVRPLRGVAGLLTTVIAGETLALMELRKVNTRRPAMWAFPGGKVERGETDFQALQREWREELGVEVYATDGPIAEAHFDLECKMDIYLYQAHIAAVPAPQAIDAQQIAWVNPAHAIEWLPCAPAQYLFYPGVRSWLARGR